MNSDKVTLRAMEPEDLDLLYRIENDRQLWDVGSTNVPYSRYVLHDYIANSSGDVYTDRQVRLIVEDGKGTTVGVADIVNFDAKNLRAEVGIVIAREHRRRGYALSAMTQMNTYARRVLHLHQLYAVVNTQNAAAISLFRKCGYDESTHLRDWLYDGKKHCDAVLMQIFL